MQGYVKNIEETSRAIRNGWYTNLGDIGFWLVNPFNGKKDIYWMSRNSAIVIRGGANYACEHINQELHKFLVQVMGFDAKETRVASVGLKVQSEHEDDCLVTIECPGKFGDKIVGEIMAKAPKFVMKGAVPSKVRFAPIPRNFKGAILVNALKKDWLTYLKSNE